MDLKKEFGTDKEKEIDGKWFPISDSAKLLIARIGNPNYAKVFRRLTRPYKRAIRTDRLPEEKSDEILIQTMAETILLGWEGLEEDGVPVTYSTTEAVRMLTEYKDFRDMVSEIASEMEAFKVEDDEEAEGNSEAS